MLYPIEQVNSHKFQSLKYFVSSSGFVYSSRMLGPYDDLRELKAFGDGRRGYLKVKLYPINHKPITVSVHRLVYTTINKIPYGIEGEINHIDGNKLNNSIENLELLSPKDNVRHSIRNKLSPSRAHQLTLERAIEIYLYAKKHIDTKNYSQIARDVGYTSKIIHQLINSTHTLSKEIEAYLSNH